MTLDSAQWGVIDNWDPEVRPVHCSNCINAKVSGNDKSLVVTCAEGHGRRASLSYWALMRQKHPMGFIQPKKCPGWESMDDG